MALVVLAGEDFAVLQQVQSTLEGDGYEVLSVASGLDAHAGVVEQQAALAILETNIPVFNGFETCRMIRDDPDAPANMPIVLLSADTIDARKMEEAGATAQLLKSHSSTEFRDLIVALVESA